MNYSRLALAALGGTLASFAFGFLMFWLLPGLMQEPRNYPAVFRAPEEMNAVMPIGFAASLLAILVAAAIFAMMRPGSFGAIAGARFGTLIGLFVVCAVVLHNYANLNIGLKLTVIQAATYFVQWTITGTVIGLIYRPPATP